MNSKRGRFVAVFVAIAGAAAYWWANRAPDVPEGPIADQLKWVVERAAREDGFGGSVFVVRGGQRLYAASFGAANHKMGQPNSATTKFMLASVSKPFTAVLILRLVEAGNLTLESTLDSVFAEVEGHPAGRITIHELLTHTSGVEEIIDRHPDHRITPEEVATAAINSRGEFRYSSTGYVILALVIEKTTGLPFASALEKYLLEPAEMINSGVVRSAGEVDSLAVGYKQVDESLLPIDLGFAPEAVDGAGSMYATADDVRLFVEALKSDRLLTAEMRKRMLTEQVPGRFGYGWYLAEQGGQRYPWHSGDIPGYHTALVWQTHRDETIVILSNQENSDVGALRQQLLRVLKKQPTE